MNKQFAEWFEKTYLDNTIELFNSLPFSMRWGVYLEFFRDAKGVAINIYRNGSGWLWSIEMSDSGTSLGWSDFTGDCKFSKTFTSFNKAAEDIIDLEINYGCYHEACKDKSIISNHWSNYALTLKERRSPNKRN